MSEKKSLEPIIYPAFATPFAQISYPDCELLNQQLEQFFDQLTAQGDKYRNPRLHNYAQDALFESNFDLFKYDNAAVQRLRHFVLQSVAWVMARLNGYSKADLDRLQLNADAWFHITEFAGYFYTHNHPMASWSAVYCVNPGTSPADKPDSGVLRFHDPRPHANTYLDAGNARLNAEYATSNLNFKLKAGQLVIFPSYLQHEVAPFMGNDRRITVAVNCWSNRYGG